VARLADTRFLAVAEPVTRLGCATRLPARSDAKAVGGICGRRRRLGAGAKGSAPYSVTAEQIAAGRAFYNYEYVNPGLGDLSGDSVFFKDEAGRIFHTYSTYGRGGEEFLGVYRYLDVTPRGRSEDGPYNTLADWVRSKNMYGKGGLVEGSGRYYQPDCACAVHQ